MLTGYLFLIIFRSINAASHLIPQLKYKIQKKSQNILRVFYFLSILTAMKKCCSKNKILIRRFIIFLFASPSEPTLDK